MTAQEKKRLCSVVTVPRVMFDRCRRELWGRADDSRTVFHSIEDPLVVNQDAPQAAFIADLLREALAQPYFLEYDRADYILDTLDGICGPIAKADILKFINERHAHIYQQEAIDAAKDFVAAHDIRQEIDEISPPACFSYFHKAVKNLDQAADATFLFGYYMGLAAAAREGARK